MADETKVEPGALDGLVKEGQPEPESETPPVEETPTETPKEEPAQEQVNPEAAKPAEDTEQKGHEFDKGLQKLQQRQATFERKLDELLAKIGQQGGVATPAQREQVATLQQQVDDIDVLSKTAPDEIDPYKATKILASKVKELQTQLEERNRTDKVRIESVQQTVGRLQDERDRADFARLNPEVADQYDNLINSTLEYVNSLGNLTPEARQIHATYTWQAKLAEAKAKAKPVATTATLKTTPDKSTVGTKVATNSASAAGRGKPASSTMDFINGLVNEA